MFCCRLVPDCPGGEWTSYVNADVPGGEGDFETLWNARLIDPSICENPIAVDARIVKSCLHWTVLGRGEISGSGFVCKNTDPYFVASDDQSSSYFRSGLDDAEWVEYSVDDYPCDDYEVRFCCPKCKIPNSVYQHIALPRIRTVFYLKAKVFYYKAVAKLYYSIMQAI